MENLAGSLLLASSVISDPNFRKAVVLVAEHSDQGAFGVVINRRAPVPVEVAAPGLAGLVDPGTPLFLGGPVQPQNAIVLADVEQADLATGFVVGSIGLLSPDAAAEGADGIRRARVFAGYAGWGPGQLEVELAGSAWVVEPALPDDVFTTEPERLWSAVLRRKGGHFKVLALMPWDPALN